METSLSFENLDVYKVGMQFYVFTVKVTSKIPKGYGDLGDQMRRAALSTVNNIAESSGRLTKADKKKFFGIARGSAMESAANLHAMKILGLCDDKKAIEGKTMIIRVVSMLTKMCR